MRRRLPKRRQSETFTVEHAGQVHAVTIGCGPAGIATEIFAHGAKPGSQLDLLLDDAGVVLSLLLQHGGAPEGLAASMGRTGGTAASIVGVLVDLLAAHPVITQTVE